MSYFYRLSSLVYEFRGRHFVKDSVFPSRFPLCHEMERGLGGEDLSEKLHNRRLVNATRDGYL